VLSEGQVLDVLQCPPSPILPLVLHEHRPLCLLFLFLVVLYELSHIQAAPSRNPFLGLLDGQGCNKPQASCPVGKDPDHPRAPLYLLIEALEAVGGAYGPAIALREGLA
jgi:hypothetical protein